MSTRPTWPSLYNWVIEVYPVEGKDPVQPDATYLYNHNGAYREPHFLSVNLTDRRHLPLYSILDARLLHTRIHSGRLICLLEPHFPSSAGPATEPTRPL